MISDRQFVVTIIWGVAALLVLGYMFYVGHREPKEHEHEDNYIHFW